MQVQYRNDLRCTVLQVLQVQYCINLCRTITVKAGIFEFKSFFNLYDNFVCMIWPFWLLANALPDSLLLYNFDLLDRAHPDN